MEEKERKHLEREQKKAKRLEEKRKEAAMKGRGKKRRVEESLSLEDDVIHKLCMMTSRTLRWIYE